MNSAFMDMKRKLKGKVCFLLVGVALLLCCSCHKTQDDNGMLRARILTIKAAGDSVPEQALASLDSLREEVMISGSMHLERIYELTKIRLRDKADWTFHSDDTINMLCNYFDSKGSPAEQMEAQYYLGRVSREIKNYPQAVEAFLQAIKIGEKKTNIDMILLRNCYSQASGLYRLQYLNKDALEMAIKGLTLTQSLGITDPIDYMDVGTSALYLGDTVMALKYFDEALKKIREESSGRRYPGVVGELLIRFSRAGRREEANYCLACLDSLPERRRPHNYLNGLASYFMQFVSADSAARAYSLLYEKSTLWGQKMISSQALSSYYLKKGDIENAGAFFSRFLEATDSVKKEREYEQTAIASGEQLFRRSREAELAAREEAARYRAHLFRIAGAGVVLILALILFFSARQKHFINALHKKNQIIDRMRKKLDDINLQLAEKQEELETLNGRVSHTATQLNEKDKNLRVAKMELGKVKRQAKTQQDKIAATRAELKRAQKRVQDLVSCEVSAHADDETTSLVSRIASEVRTSQTGTAEISDKEWSLLAAHIEAMHPGFQQSLKEGVRNLSPQKLHAALLWKMGMSRAQIARQMGFTRPTASRWVEEIEAAMIKMNEH